MMRLPISEELTKCHQRDESSHPVKAKERPVYDLSFRATMETPAPPLTDTDTSATPFPYLEIGRQDSSA